MTVSTSPRGRSGIDESLADGEEAVGHGDHPGHHGVGAEVAVRLPDDRQEGR
ncbi:MAG: hypothetical protein ACRD29_03495 [Acidimicrobiales bacterium]